MKKTVYESEGNKPSEEDGQEVVEVRAARVESITGDDLELMRGLYGEEKTERFLARVAATKDPRQTEKLRRLALKSIHGSSVIKEFRGKLFRIYPVMRKPSQSFDPFPDNPEKREAVIAKYRYRLMVDAKDNNEVVDILNPDADMTGSLEDELSIESEDSRDDESISEINFDEKAQETSLS